MAIFTGAGVAIVTPFHEDESINYDRLDELIDFHCENGTDCIIICGTTGESATNRPCKRAYPGHCRDRFQLYEDCGGAVKGGC